MVTGDYASSTRVTAVAATAANFDSVDFAILAILLIVAACLTLPGLNWFGLIDPSDALYAECAREMLELHSYVIPLSNYDQFFEKPILIYWLIIAFYKVFGVHEWVARLPSALSLIATACSVFLFVRRDMGRTIASTAVVVLLTCPLLAVLGHLCLTDVLLSFLTSTAMLGGFYLTRTAGNRLLLFLVTYLALGLGLLTKGPLAVALFVLVLAVDHFFSGRWRHCSWWLLSKRLALLPGLIFSSLVAAPWYWAVCNATGGRFFEEFFVRQNFGRLMGTVNHQHPFWFYVPFLLAGLFPWNLLLFAPRSFMKLLNERKYSCLSSQLFGFCFYWAVTLLLFFSCVKTKHPTYIAPALPAIAILLGTVLNQSTAGVIRVCGVVSATMSVSCLGALVYLLVEKTAIPNGASSAIILVFLAVAFCLALLSALLCFRGRSRLGVNLTMLSVLITFAVFYPILLTDYERRLHEPFRILVERVKHDSATLGLFLGDSSAAPFYLQKRVRIVDGFEQLNTFKSEPGAVKYLLCRRENAAGLPIVLHRFKIVETRGSWLLVQLLQ